MAKPKRVSLKGRGADIFFGDYPPAAAPATDDQAPADPIENAAAEPAPVLSVVERSQDTPPRRPTAARPATRSIPESTGRSSNQSIDQLTDQSPAKSTTPPFDSSPILGKPKGFYITEQQDEDLNAAVTKLAAVMKGRGAQKIDRSTVVRLLLETSALTDDQTINRLANRLVNRLVNQLTN